MSDTQTSLFDQVDDGWTGPELGAYGASTSNGAEGIFALINGVSTGGVPVNAVIRWTAAVSGLTSGQMRYRIGNVWVALPTSDGGFSGEQISDDTDLGVHVGSTQCNSGATMLTSAKEFLEVAS